MDKKISKILNPVLLGLAFLVSISGILMGGFMTKNYIPKSGIPPEPARSEGVDFSTDLFLNFSYIFIIVVIIAVIAGSIISMLDDLKGSMRSIISLVAMVVIFGLLYAAMADSNVLGHGTVLPDGKKVDMYKDFKITMGQVRFVDTTLLLSYFLGIAAFFGVIAGEIRGAIK
ncbi:MAG: hypothetical protein EAZ44_09475 [Cytophagia bacterium]|nr:MAG: hypothetical protein EAZ44_09475 [Cytophagia bacterium]TAG46569.1 MAG: hypothetical protein EAZ31_00255 [Cytophagia bacterium]TAH29170.1 MAG: hypothetical protein EAZ06_07725 [Cytophagales bacterium]